MVELCEDAEGVGGGEVTPFRVFIHGVDDMFNFQLGGSVPH